jgi:hypothetical protein
MGINLIDHFVTNLVREHWPKSLDEFEGREEFGKKRLFVDGSEGEQHLPSKFLYLLVDAGFVVSGIAFLIALQLSPVLHPAPNIVFIKHRSVDLLNKHLFLLLPHILDGLPLMVHLHLPPFPLLFQLSSLPIVPDDIEWTNPLLLRDWTSVCNCSYLNHSNKYKLNQD